MKERKEKELIQQLTEAQYPKCRVPTSPIGAALVMAIESGLVKKHWNGRYEVMAFNIFWRKVEDIVIQSVAEQVYQRVKEILWAGKSGEEPAEEQADPELSKRPAAGTTFQIDRFDKRNSGKEQSCDIRTMAT